jgi:hypothetical protein
MTKLYFLIMTETGHLGRIIMTMYDIIQSTFGYICS